MSNPFYDHPIVNSPYEYAHQHWELDPSGQPTGRLIDRRRRAELITPIPKPNKRKGKEKQEELLLDVSERSNAATTERLKTGHCR